MLKLKVLLGLLAVVACQDDEFLYDTFPENFQWGFATASYQVKNAPEFYVFRQCVCESNDSIV